MSENKEKDAGEKLKEGAKSDGQESSGGSGGNDNMSAKESIANQVADNDAERSTRECGQGHTEDFDGPANDPRTPEQFLSDEKASGSYGSGGNNKGYNDYAEHLKRNKFNDPEGKMDSLGDDVTAMDNSNDAFKSFADTPNISDMAKSSVSDGGAPSVVGKVANVADKASSVGDKVTKGVVGAKVGAGAGIAQGIAAMTAKVSAAVNTIVSGTANLLGSIVTGAKTLVASTGTSLSAMFGTSASASQLMATGMLVTTVATTGGVTAAIATESQKKDATVICIPHTTSVSASSQDYVAQGAGELDAQRLEVIKKFNSFAQVYGMSNNHIAGMLGNFVAEGGMDPTSIEGILDEPFMVGSKKEQALSVGLLARDVTSPGGEYYRSRGRPKVTIGLGLMQWSNGRNTNLLAYAKEIGLDWFDASTQILFMIDGEEEYEAKRMQKFLATEFSTPEAAADHFMNEIERPSDEAKAKSGPKRRAEALRWAAEVAEMEVDKVYAESILSQVNVERSKANSSAGAYHQDDGCGDSIASHYSSGNYALDGTGQVPPGLDLTPWKPEDLPDSMKEFAHNPEDAGMTYGNQKGWHNFDAKNGGQCVTLSVALMQQLYPDWNKAPRSAPGRITGNGGVQAGNWASHYGSTVSKTPAAGAIWSDTSTSNEGHTGIVSHVFANGDIVVIEQNVPGYSGGKDPANYYQWNFRVVTKVTMDAKKSWTFFKPEGEPQWVSENTNVNK